MRTLRVDDRGMASLFVSGQPVRRRINRRQDMPAAWTMNGAIYLFRTPVLLRRRAEPLRRAHRRVRHVAARRHQHRLARRLGRSGTHAGARQDGQDGQDRRDVKNKGARVSRPDMDIEAHRDLKLLEAVEQDSRVTQRSLASKLGIALGLTNIYLKRLVRKGYIKCVNVQSNRITYLITPRGIAEKARLTYEFMDYSLHLYGEVRQHLREALQACAAADRRVAIYGRGEAAELAYLSLEEFGLEPVAIFDENNGAGQGERFLGMTVRPIAEHDQVAYDLMIVATLERSGSQFAVLSQCGVPKDKLFRCGTSRAANCTRSPTDDRKRPHPYEATWL